MGLRGKGKKPQRPGLHSLVKQKLRKDIINGSLLLLLGEK